MNKLFGNLIFIFCYLILLEFIIHNTSLLLFIKKNVFNNTLTLILLACFIIMLSCNSPDLSILVFISFSYLYLKLGDISIISEEESKNIETFKRRRRRKNRRQRRRKKRRLKRKAKKAKEFSEGSGVDTEGMDKKELAKLTGTGDICVMPKRFDGTYKLPEHGHIHNHPAAIEDIHPVYAGVSNIPKEGMIKHSHRHPHKLDRMHIIESFRSKRKKKKKKKKRRKKKKKNAAKRAVIAKLTPLKEEEDESKVANITNISDSDDYATRTAVHKEACESAGGNFVKEIDTIAYKIKAAERTNQYKVDGDNIIIPPLYFGKESTYSLSDGTITIPDS